MNYFDHEKFIVYQSAIEFIQITNEFIETVPSSKEYLANQLKRAGSSIALNIAEGAGEFSPNEKRRFYRMAKRSATECAAIIDICKRLELIEPELSSKSRALLLRIVCMLIKLIKS